MWFSDIEREKIAKYIVRQIKDKGVSDEAAAADLIVQVISTNIKEEKAIEEDAMKLLQQHKKAMGSSIDHDKALRMIKQKLAEERKFVL